MYVHCLERHNCNHYVTAPREGAGDVSNWNWLGMNESMDAPTPTEKT